MDKRRCVILFLCVEAVLYLGFLALDLFLPVSGADVVLKYLSILLCFGMSLLFLRAGGSGLVCAALGFTLLADFFLLVLNRYYLLGILSFCVVQVLYLRRIRYAKRGRLWPSLLVRGLFVAAACYALGQLGMLDIPTAAAAFYCVQLVGNAVESLLLGRRARLFSVGLLLFVACDLCVGLYNAGAFLPLSGGLFGLISIGMWLFYLPSQVLLTLSGRVRFERMR